jgi:hypothetical protein
VIAVTTNIDWINDQMAAVKVEGTVTRIFFEGKGIGLTETYKSQSGEDWTRKWTLWFTTDPNLAEGDKLSVTGSLSTKVVDFKGQDGETKQIVEASVNNAVIIGEVTKATASAAVSAPF